MINTDARIQINRDALKKIVKLTAESKIDKARIKALKDGINRIINCIDRNEAFELYRDLNNLLKKDNHE